MKVQTTRIYAEISKAVAAGYTTISEQGSSRSSKTYNTLIWLIVYLLQHPKTRAAIVRKSMPTIKGSVYHDFEEIMKDKMGLWADTCMNKTEMVYRFPNGSELEFFGCDNEQKMRGRKRDVLYCNEANELAFIEWQQLKMRTTRFAIVDYNPSYSDDHWLCTLNADPRTYHFITTYKDNPFLEQAVIDEIESLKDKNPALWQIYGLGLQAVVEGLIFKNVDVVDNIPRGAMEWHRKGVDYGFTNDSTAIVDVYIHGRDMYIDEVCYRTQMLTGDIIRELKDPTDPNVKIIAESADPRMNTEIRRAGLNLHEVRKYKGSIEAGITKMLEYNIHVTRRSVNVLKEFHNYTYQQTRDGRWLNTPIDAFNHAIDACRYVILEEVLGGPPKKLDLDALRRIAY